MNYKQAWEQIHDSVMAIELGQNLSTVLEAMMKATATPFSENELHWPLCNVLWWRITIARSACPTDIIDSLQTFFEMGMKEDLFRCQMLLEEIHQFCKSRALFNATLCSLPFHHEDHRDFGVIGPTRSDYDQNNYEDFYASNSEAQPAVVEPTTTTCPQTTNSWDN